MVTNCKTPVFLTQINETGYFREVYINIERLGLEQNVRYLRGQEKIGGPTIVGLTISVVFKFHLLISPDSPCVCVLVCGSVIVLI